MQVVDLEIFHNFFWQVSQQQFNRSYPIQVKLQVAVLNSKPLKKIVFLSKIEPECFSHPLKTQICKSEFMEIAFTLSMIICHCPCASIAHIKPRDLPVNKCFQYSKMDLPVSNFFSIQRSVDLTLTIVGISAFFTGPISITLHRNCLTNLCK